MMSAEKRGARWCLRPAVIGLAVLLAGCAPEKPPPQPGPFGQYIRSVPRKPIQARVGQPKGKPDTTPAEAASLRDQPAGPAVEPQPEQTALAIPSSNELIGLDPQHTAELLGPAAQTNKRSPATVWHYKSGRCELDLSFYMEMRSGQMRTLHYDFKEAASPEQRQACLRSIIEENRKPEHS
jgi:hypothetical protein